MTGEWHIYCLKSTTISIARKMYWSASHCYVKCMTRVTYEMLCVVHSMGGSKSKWFDVDCMMKIPCRWLCALTVQLTMMRCVRGEEVIPFLIRSKKDPADRLVPFITSLLELKDLLKSCQMAVWELPHILSDLRTPRNFHHPGGKTFNTWTSEEDN